MLEAAATGLAGGAGARTSGILAITVLTSLDEASLAASGVAATPGKLTAKRARLAEISGCEGVICSPKELGVVADVAPDLLKVTPGIRPEGLKAHDQRRTATPQDALARGADLLVVGRAITGAADPIAAAESIAAGLGHGSQ